MSVTVRFAPSPTGLLHIGNARTALFNALFALKSGGRFVLRFDDTDAARSRAEFAEAIERDLAWLGMQPDLTVRQSERLALYDAAAERLKQAGRLYPCWETPDELERKRKRLLARRLPPIYDRAALKLDPATRARMEAEGRAPHWRFLLDRREMVWDDLVRGRQHIDTGSVSDPVLIRADGSYLYTLPSVVDDIEMGVTQVIRGEDHVANTGAQIELFEALGAAPPAFGHHNLLTNATGEGLSKRLGHLSLSGLRERGLEPMAVASLAVLIGTAETVEPYPDLDALGAHFDLGHVSRAPARFDEAELAHVNAKLVHGLAYAAVAERLAAQGIEGGEPFWLAVRANCAVVADAALWWRAIELGHAEPAPEDRDFLSQARALVPPEPWGEGTFALWTGLLKQQTGRKGRSLFLPLRRALTGLDHGPELGPILPLIGRTRSLARLS